jgi:hypothetical protein
MTVTYSLTRVEVLRTFLYALPRSPRILTLVIGTSCLMALLSLSGAHVLPRGLSLHDSISAFLWFVGTFCFMPVWVFLRAKTNQRLLTISEQGFHTEIGRIRADCPWSKVKEVKDVGPYLLMVSWIGNALFIPSRAFTDDAMRDQFIAEVARYRARS